MKPPAQGKPNQSLSKIKVSFEISCHKIDSRSMKKFEAVKPILPSEEDLLGAAIPMD